MYIIMGIALIFIGAIMIFNPNAVFHFSEGWKTYSAAEPSDLYIISTRIGGTVMVVLGLAAIILFFFI